MVYPSIDKLLNVVDSKYKLIYVASARAKEMKDIKFYQMKKKDYYSSKELGKALEEVAEGLIHIK